VQDVCHERPDGLLQYRKAPASMVFRPKPCYSENCETQANAARIGRAGHLSAGCRDRTGAERRRWLPT